MGSNKPINETGNKYGFLTVLSKTEDYTSNGYKWVCLCDCGAIKVTNATNLRSGNTRSCGGCGLVFLPGDEAAMRQALNNSRNNAHRRGYEFMISNEEFRSISSRDCFYCGTPPANKHLPARPRPGALPFFYNGLDRIDNNIGYISSNVVPCCFVCNRAKSDSNLPDFLGWIKRLAKHQSNLLASLSEFKGGDLSARAYTYKESK